MASRPKETRGILPAPTLSSAHEVSEIPLGPRDRVAIQEWIERIKESRAFRSTPHHVKCLDFVVKQFLDGRKNRIEPKELADKLFDKADPSNARSQMQRIREQLNKYLQEVPTDPIRIKFHHGDYLPRLYRRVPPPSTPDPPANPVLRSGVKSHTAHTSQRWNIPRPNRFFTGREAFVATLRELLLNNSSGPIAQPQAITGLGGIGKTQTAIEYAYRYRDHYAAGLWLNAESRDSLLSGCVSIANRLDLPHRADENFGRVAEAVRWWLEANCGWLLILDNVDDLDVVSEFIPASRGHCLVTTRMLRIGSLGESLELSKLDKAEGALFLLRRAKRISITAELEIASDADRKVAEEITNELGGLPLALDQAGAYIDEAPLPLPEYLKLYRSYGAQLLAERGHFSAEHLPVSKTFQLALAKVKAENPAAADIVRVGSLLAPDAIPEELFWKGGKSLVPDLNSSFSRAKAFKEAARFGLIRRDKERQSFDMHRVVQLVIRDSMDEIERRHWGQRVLNQLAESFPSPGLQTWNECEPLAAHVTAFARCMGSCDVTDDVAKGTLLDNCGTYLWQRKRFWKDVHLVLRKAFLVRKKVLGREHPNTLTTAVTLAAFYCSVGKFRRAEPMYIRALRILKKTLGGEHPDVATCLDGLGNVYFRQIQSVRKFFPEYGARNLEYAQQLYAQALNIRRRTLGTKHAGTMATAMNMAETFFEQGALEFAERAYKKVLEHLDETLGESHADTIGTRHRLAVLYRSTGRYEEGKDLFRQALASAEKTFGPNHEIVGKLLSDYAGLLEKASRETEARDISARYEGILAKAAKTSVAGLADAFKVLRELSFEDTVAVVEKGWTDRTRDDVRKMLARRREPQG